MRPFMFFAAAALALCVAPSSAQEVAKPGDGISPPVAIKVVRPEYTEAAQAARIEGAVVLEAVVLNDGTVGDVTVTESLDPELDEQAVIALKQWQFEPGRKDGTAVAVQVHVQLMFTLK
jgi:TonB family protein